MFSQAHNETHIDKFVEEKTASNFSKQSNQQSFIYELQAEKQYVERLRLQRQRIETLYSKYDILLGKLKTNQIQLRQKDSNLLVKLEKVIEMESRCKDFDLQVQSLKLFQKKFQEVQGQNIHFQQALSSLQRQYELLLKHSKQKEFDQSKGKEHLHAIIGDLDYKMKQVYRTFQDKEKNYLSRNQQITLTLENFKRQTKRQKEKFNQKIEHLRISLLEKQEQCNSLKIDNNLLHQKLNEDSCFYQKTIEDYEQKIQTTKAEKNAQGKLLKQHIASLNSKNVTLEKSLAKFQEQLSRKDIALNELTCLLDERQAHASQSLFITKQQEAQERNYLKQQIGLLENQSSRYQRQITQHLKLQQELTHKIRKYQACLSAKRTIREVEMEQLNKINSLLRFE